MKITFREAARDDLTRQFRYYLLALNLPELAVRFREAAKKTARAIRDHPDSGPPYRLQNPQLQNLRSWPVPGFESIRFYSFVDRDAIHLIPILHGKRDVRSILEAESNPLSESSRENSER